MNSLQQLLLRKVEQLEQKVNKRIENANALLDLISDYEVLIPQKFPKTIPILITRLLAGFKT
ncbi:hypothetical protein CM15mP35_01530 [bacterium]|nr:MAG: hypothetical protein CM15mP35_01530 [bacterium]